MPFVTLPLGARYLKKRFTYCGRYNAPARSGAESPESSGNEETMIDPIYEPDDAEAAALAQAGMNAICEWLDAPPPLQASDELSPLRTHLAALRDIPATAHQRAAALEQLYTRSMRVVDSLLPSLADVALPVPRKTRHVVRSLQDLLQTLAKDLITSLGQLDEHLIRGLRQAQDLTLWRSLQALAHHLLISDLVASPASPGIWAQLHGTFSIANRLQIADHTPEGTHASLAQIYQAALLLGCAQPASFTSREIGFVADYLKYFANHAEIRLEGPQESPGTFWIHSRHDTPPYACSRKTAPLDPEVIFFSCDQLSSLLEKQLDALSAGSTTQQIDLPDFAGTPAGQGVLRRLANYWGHPGKRRFPRRRQNYRAALCSGLDSLWHLFQDEDAAAADVSSWMITNESPDGYAIMHVSGKTGKLRVGDITAIRTESGNDWQICLVRWALSENPEHLELGLQILAARAVPAILALPSGNRNSENSRGRLLPVLILPEVPMLRPTETLIAPSGKLADHHDKFTLVIDQENIEVREVRATRLDEQTDSVVVFSIQPAD
jgi:hypothetical protein